MLTVKLNDLILNTIRRINQKKCVPWNRGKLGHQVDQIEHRVVRKLFQSYELGEQNFEAVLAGENRLVTIAL